MSVAIIEAAGVVRYEGVGAPTWSPDARWVAVPCEGDRVAVLDMDPQGHRVAIPVRHQPGDWDGRLSVVVVQLGGAGPVAGHQCIFACGNSNEPYAMHSPQLFWVTLAIDGAATLMG